MDQTSTFQSPLNLLSNYVPRDVASEMHDVPLFMIEFWMAHRRIRIAEFRKEGEGKRSIYVNKEDVGILKDVYDEIRLDLLNSNESITYEEALELYPELTPIRLKYLIKECHVEAYLPDRESYDKAVMRVSSLDDAVSKLKTLDERYSRVLEVQSNIFDRDISRAKRRMVFITLFIDTFKIYRFNPVVSVNFRSLTTCCNGDTRLEYREGYNNIDLLLSGEFNGLCIEEEQI